MGEGSGGLRGVAIAGLGALALVACASPGPTGAAPAEQPPAPSRAAASPSASTASRPAASPPANPAAGPAGTAPPTSGDAPPAHVARAPRRPSTPGKIACETTECDLATEICCVTAEDDAPAGTCVPRPGAPGGRSPCCAPGTSCWQGVATVERACDETADCPRGQQCGEIDAGEGALGLVQCGDRQPVEVCLAGSTCGNGNACEAPPDATLGRCSLQIAPPTCGAETCERGETCCWSLDQQRGRCAETCAEGDLHFVCTSPAQCDHSDCDSYPGAPIYDCGGGSFQMGVLCRTVKDCPKQLTGRGVGPGAPTLRGCKRLDGAPPSVKACVYE